MSVSEEVTLFRRVHLSLDVNLDCYVDISDVERFCVRKTKNRSVHLDAAVQFFRLLVSVITYEDREP